MLYKKKYGGGLKMHLDDKFNWFFKKYIKNSKKDIFLILCLIIVGIAISSIGPFLYGQMIDNISQKNIYSLIKKR